MTMTDKRLFFRPTPEQLIYFEKRLRENHKTPSDYLRQILNAYIELDKQGGLDEYGDKQKKAEEIIALQSKSQIEIETAQKIATIKLEAAKELKKLTRKEPRGTAKVDWKGCEGEEPDFGTEMGNWG